MTYVWNKATEAGGALLDAGTKLVSGGTNFVLDKVIKPTGSLLTGVVSYVADDPLKALAQGVAIGTGHPELLPLIEGADAVIAGKDLSQAMEATAKAYIMQQAGSYVGKAAGAYAAETAASAGAEVATQKLAATIASGAAGSAAVAAVAGKDVLQALAVGGVSAGAGALLGKVEGYNSLPTAAKNAIGAAVMTTLSKGNPSTAVIGSLIASSGVAGDIIKSFDPNGTILKDDASKAVVTDILMGSATAALAGGNVSNAVRAAMMKNGSKALGDAVTSGLTGKVSAVTEASKAAEAKATELENNVTAQNSAASSYNNIGAQLQIRVDEQKRLSDAANAAVNKYQAKYGEWKTLYDAASSDAGYTNYLAKQGYQSITTGDWENGYTTTYAKVVGYDQAIDWDTGQAYPVPRYETAPSKESLITQANAKAKEVEPLVAPTDAAVNAANNYTTSLNNDYANFYRPELTKYQSELDTLKGQYTTLKKGYDGAVDTFVASTNNLKAALDPIYYTSDRAFVEAMDPNFKAEEYRKLVGLPADANVYDYYLGKGQFEGTPTNLKAAEGQIGAERTRLVTGALAQSGLSLDNADPQKVAEMVDKLDAAYGNNLTALKAASIQDVVNNNTRTLEEIKADATVPRVEIAGTSYGDWRKPEGFTAPAGLRLATLQEMEGGQATAQLDSKGRYVWMAKDDATMPTQWNPATGATDMGTVTVTGKKPTTAELYQVYADQETDSMLSSMFKGIAVVTAGGVGEQMQNWSSALALQFNGNMNNVGYQLGSMLSDWAKNNSPATLKTQMQNISTEMAKIGKIDGFWDQLGAVKDLIKQNPAAYLTYVAQEGVQEILPKGAGFIAGAITTALSANPPAGVSAAVLTATVIDGIETLGSTGRDVYTALRAQGVSEEDARARALMAGWQAAAVTAPSEALANAAVFMPYIKGMGYGANAVLQGVRGTAAEGISETIETYTQARITQYASGVPQDHNSAMAQALFAGFVGTGTGGVVMSPAVASGSLDIGKDIYGNTLTWAGLTSGNQIADFNTINGNAVIGTDSNGNDITVAGAVYAGQQSQAGADILSVAPEPPKFTQWIDPYVFDVSEVKAAAAAEGYTIDDATAASMAGLKSEQAATTQALAQFDPLATTLDEARQMLVDQGYNPTDAEVRQFVASLPEATQQQSVSAYVDPRQMTFDEAKDYLVKQGYNPTDDEVRQFVGQTDEATRAQEITAYADPRMVTEQEVKDAYAALGLKKPTAADVAALVGQYDQSTLTGKATANLDAARYNSIMEQLDGLSAGASQETLDAIAKVKADLNDQITSMGGDITSLSGSLDLTRADLLTAIESAKAAGLQGDAALQAAIGQVAGDLGTTKEELLAKLGTSEQQLRQDFASQIGTVQTQIGDVQTALTQAIADAKAAGLEGDAALQSAINKVAGDLGTTKTDLLAQLGTTEAALRQDFAAQIGTVQTQIGDVQTALTQAIADAKAAGLEGDAALQSAINKVAGDLGTTKTDLLAQLGTTEAALRQDFASQIGGLTADVQAKYDSLTSQQKALADQLVQQGVDLNSAITQATTAISQDVQAKYDSLTAQQKALADQLVQQGVDLNSAITQATTAISQDVQAKYDALSQGQKDIVAQLQQQGVDLNAAITQAQAQTQQQITDVQQDVQTKFDTLTQGQKDLVTQLTQQGVDLQHAIDLAQQATQQQFADITETINANQAATQKAIADTAAQTQAKAAAEAQATRNAAAQNAINQAKLGNINTLMGMLGQAGDATGQQVTVKSADPAKIGYIYDWSSIFANPSQEKMFASPYGSYASGGAVRNELEDVNDELLKILRG